MSIKGAYKYHANKRCEERFGFSLTHADRKEITKQIHLGKSEYLGGSSNSRTMHKVKLRGEILTVVYSKTQKTIVTVMKGDTQGEIQS